MEGNQGTSQPTATPTGPEAGAAETPSSSEKVLYNGQEMEVENFLKTRKHKVKVDGKEAEVGFDELLNGYSHGSAANARMREAAEAKKEMEAAKRREKELIDSIYGWKDKPETAFETLEKLGIDIDSYAHDRVLKKMQLEMMTPEERRSYDMEQELNRYKSREAKEAEAKQQAELQGMREQAVTELEKNILGHLEQQGGNISPAIVGRAVDALIASMEAGEQISIKDAFDRANGWFEKERKGIFESELRALLSQGQVPKELAEAVRKADLAALRKDPPKRQASESRTETKKSVSTSDDFFNDLERKYRK